MSTTSTRDATVIDQRQVRYFEMQHRRVPQGRFFIPLADLYRRLDRLEEAETLLREGLTRHPDSISARVVLAEVMAARGVTDEAVSLWDEVLERDPGHAYAAERRSALVAGEATGTVVPAEAGEPGTDQGGSETAPVEEPVTDGLVGGSEEPAAPPSEEVAPPPSEEVAPATAAPPPPPPLVESEAPAGDVPEVFLTGTLADIYLRQGHRRKALRILRRVLERHPEREDVARRIAELERETAEEETA